MMIMMMMIMMMMMMMMIMTHPVAVSVNLSIYPPVRSLACRIALSACLAGAEAAARLAM
eukprot:COSAG06_NODE_48725_length_330_cov_0.662338_1_plen_58_part_10